MLLSTHSMEEAVALGDRIAVMVDGSIAASGTRARLQQQYGSGFVLEVCACDGAGDRVKELLQTYGAELIERFCDSLKFSIHRSKMTLSEAFIMMNRLTLNQQHRDTSSPSDLAEKEMIEDKIVRFYSISHSTMQDVFMAIVLQKRVERE